MRSASRLFRSLTFRLALYYSAVFVISVAFLLGGAYWAGVIQPLHKVHEAVDAEANQLIRAYERDSREAFIARLEQRAKTPSRRAPYHALVDPAGRVASSNLVDFPPPRAQRDWQRFEFETYSAGDEEHEVLARDVTFSDGMRLLLGRETEDLDEREDFLQEALIWGAGFTVVVGFAGGLLMSVAVGRRIEAVGRTARRVIDGEMSERIALRGSGDDFDQLAETLNQMLDRIEALVQSVSRVSDQIAHELRTPLARLRADLETLARKAADDPEQRRLAEQALAEAERLSSTFDALLRIARIETGRHQARLAALDLSALLRDAVDLYLPEAQARDLTVETTIADGLWVEGDRNLLFQAVSNLLDNAIKFSPAGSRLRLTAKDADHTVTIAVRDQGPGVGAEHLPNLTERFFRAPEADPLPGLGLGLSLVAAVAQLHGSALRLSNLDPGFCAELDLRRPPAEAG